MGIGQEDRQGRGPSLPVTILETGRGKGVLLQQRPGLPRFHPAQSPNPAMSGPSSPTLAPAQLCSWPPPAAPAAGPKARAGAADTTIQLKLGLEPEAWGGLWGQAWRARGGKGRGGESVAARRVQGFGGLDRHHQGLCFLPQTHTHTHTMEYYSAMKKNEIMPFAATWMDLEIIILREVSQREKDKYHMISLI